MNQRKIGVIISYFTLVFNVVIGLVYTPFMISKLGDGLYGIYALSNSLISFVVLLDLGFGQTIVRYISQARVTGNTEEEHKLNGFFLKLYLKIAVIAIIIGGALVYFYPLLAEKNLTIEEIAVFRVVFSILLVNVVVSFPMSVFSATMNAYECFFALKLVNLISNMIKYALMFTMLLFGYKLIVITVISLICSLLSQGFNLVYSVRKLNIKFDFSKTDSELISEIKRFSFFIFLNLIIDFLYSNTDKLILGVVSGTVAVSVYSIGVYFLQYFTELSTAMSGVFLPKVMFLYKNGNAEEISNLFNRIGRLQMGLLFLVLGGFVCLGDRFIELWVGTTYSDAYIIGLLIMVPSIIPLTQNIGITIIRVLNIHKYRSYMYIGIAVLNVMISIPLAMKYGGIGSAIGTCVATVMGQIVFMNCFYNKKAGIKIKTYWNSFVRFLLVTFIVTFVIRSVINIYSVSSWLRLFLVVIAYTAMYMGLYWFIIANEYEKKLIKGVILKGKMS